MGVPGRDASMPPLRGGGGRKQHAAAAAVSENDLGASGTGAAPAPAVRGPSGDDPSSPKERMAHLKAQGWRGALRHPVGTAVLLTVAASLGLFSLLDCAFLEVEVGFEPGNVNERWTGYGTVSAVGEGGGGGGGRGGGRGVDYGDYYDDAYAEDQGGDGYGLEDGDDAFKEDFEDGPAEGSAAAGNATDADPVSSTTSAEDGQSSTAEATEEEEAAASEETGIEKDGGGDGNATDANADADTDAGPAAIAAAPQSAEGVEAGPSDVDSLQAAAAANESKAEDVTGNNASSATLTGAGADTSSAASQSAEAYGTSDDAASSSAASTNTGRGGGNRRLLRRRRNMRGRRHNGAAEGWVGAGAGSHRAAAEGEGATEEEAREAAAAAESQGIDGTEATATYPFGQGDEEVYYGEGNTYHSAYSSMTNDTNGSVVPSTGVTSALVGIFSLCLPATGECYSAPDPYYMLGISAPIGRWGVRQHLVNVGGDGSESGIKVQGDGSWTMARVVGILASLTGFAALALVWLVVCSPVRTNQYLLYLTLASALLEMVKTGFFFNVDLCTSPIFLDVTHARTEGAYLREAQSCGVQSAAVASIVAVLLYVVVAVMVYRTPAVSNPVDAAAGGPGTQNGKAFSNGSHKTALTDNTAGMSDYSLGSMGMSNMDLTDEMAWQRSEVRFLDEGAGGQGQHGASVVHGQLATRAPSLRHLAQGGSSRGLGLPPAPHRGSTRGLKSYPGGPGFAAAGGGGGRPGGPPGVGYLRPPGA